MGDVDYLGATVSKIGGPFSVAFILNTRSLILYWSVPVYGRRHVETQYSLAVSIISSIYTLNPKPYTFYTIPARHEVLRTCLWVHCADQPRVLTTRVSTASSMG